MNDKQILAGVIRTLRSQYVGMMTMAVHELKFTRQWFVGVSDWAVCDESCENELDRAIQLIEEARAIAGDMIRNERTLARLLREERMQLDARAEAAAAGVNVEKGGDA